MRKISLRVSDVAVVVSLLLVLQLFRVSPLLSQPRLSATAQADPTTVSLAPQGPSVPLCENFTVNVTVSSVQDLYTWKLNMSFNSTCMECVNFQEGQFLSSSNTTQFTPPVINNTAGTITGANCTLVSASNGVSGDGTLANATFQCKNVVGQSTLYVNNIELYNSTPAEIYSGTCSDVIYQIPTVTFRLLAVEKCFSNGTGFQFPLRTAEYLIQCLRSFKNWQNVTWGDYNYRCYIHLLSAVPYAQLSSEMRNYYRGAPNKTSILNEITTFLNDTGPGESNDLTVRIFYYNGHGGSDVKNCGWINGIGWDTHTYHYLDMGPPWRNDVGDYWDYEINGTELDQALNTGDLATSNCTLVILDTCLSGGFITDECNATLGIRNLTRLGRVILTATDENNDAYGWVAGTYDSSPPSHVGNWSWFTGNQNATYDNGTAFGPLGIIGGLFNQTQSVAFQGEDRNQDGWLSAGEVFSFAFNTVTNYSESWGNSWDGAVHMMWPYEWSGVACCDVPLVLYYLGSFVNLGPEPFCYNGAPQWPPESPFPPGDWPEFGHGPDRGRVLVAPGATVPYPVWISPNVSATSSAAVVDGMVFLGTLGGQCNVTALALATGQVIWTFSASGTIYSSPAVVDGIVFIGTMGGGGGGAGGGWLYALDEYTGRVRWEFQTPNGTGIRSSPAVTDGRVFIATMQQGSTTPCAVYALNETCGASLWNFTTTTSVESSPTCANGRVFVGTMDGTIYALNASTTNPAGQPLWSYSLPGNEIFSTAASDNSSIYFGTIYGGGGGGKVYAFSQLGGPPEWQYPPTGYTPAPFSGSPAVDTARNLVVIGSDNGLVYALNRASGTVVWTATVAGQISMSSVAISKDGLVYIGSTNGFLYCLNETNNGAPVWSCPIGGPINASPALTYQHVIISSTGTNGSVRCIGPPFPVHDIAVYNLTALPSTVTPGNTVNIKYTVTNKGNVAETFQVSCLYNNTSIRIAPMYYQPTPLYAQNVTLSPGTNTTITFTWNTAGFTPGSYTIIAYANPVPGEANIYDNTLFDGTVQVVQISISGGGSRVPYAD